MPTAKPTHRRNVGHPQSRFPCTRTHAERQVQPKCSTENSRSLTLARLSRPWPISVVSAGRRQTLAADDMGSSDLARAWRSLAATNRSVTLPDLLPAVHRHDVCARAADRWQLQHAAVAMRHDEQPRRHLVRVEQGALARGAGAGAPARGGELGWRAGAHARTARTDARSRRAGICRPGAFAGT